MDSKYFPFERNHYFYGKLLTVRDFESEQRYHSAKRRLMNRLLLGTGIAAGLQVVMVDDTSVSVQAGVAFDDLGREVVLPESRTLKLSMVDGFRKSDNATNLYLCAAFKEVGKEPVQPVANPSIQSSEVSEYNRLLEGVHFFLKDSMPGPMGFEYNRLVETAVSVFENDALRITQIAPRYVEAGTVFDVRIVVERVLSTPRIDFHFELDSTVFKLYEANSDDVHCLLSAEERSIYQETVYRVKAPQSSEVARICPRIDSISLYVGDDAMTLSPDFGNSVEVVDGSVHDRVIADYFSRSVDDAMQTTGDHAIYLAKISLVQAGPSYMIQQVRPAPFADRVYSVPLLQRLVGNGSEKILERTDIPTPEQTTPLVREQAIDKPLKRVIDESYVGRDKVSTGIVEIDLIPRHTKLTLGKLGKGYYSPEIEHGLGEEAVSIHVAIEELHEPSADDEPNYSDERVYTGSIDVFSDSQYQSAMRSVALGTVQFPKRGTFVVGARVSNLTDQITLKIRWWAVKKGTASQLSDAELLVASSGENEGSPL